MKYKIGVNSLEINESFITKGKHLKSSNPIQDRKLNNSKNNTLLNIFLHCGVNSQTAN
jgi:hypothetical protein